MLSVLALFLVAPAFAEEAPTYLDDRSDPASIVRSYYNAVARGEDARAYSYLESPPDYAGFAAGYAETGKVEVALGAVRTEGDAGSIYATVPVAVRATALDGRVTTFAGCYATRQVQPAIQEPPFRPIEIVEGHLQSVSTEGALADAVPSDCPDRPD